MIKKYIQKFLTPHPTDWNKYKADKMAKTKEFMWQHQKYNQSQTPLNFRSRATGAHYIRH